MRTVPTVSVKDVASAAGVSVGTVSNVLNRPERVGSAMRERVETAMADLGFVRNESARQLRSGTSHVLAFLMLDAGNPFFTDVAQGVEVAADVAGLSVVMCTSGGSSTREAALLEVLEGQRVQGILVTPVDPTAPVLQEVSRRGTPLVVVDRAWSDVGLCSVAVDDEWGGRIAAEHLMDRGHRRVALIGGPPSLGQVADRFRGARAAWLAAGLDDGDLTVFETASLDVAEGHAAGRRLLDLPVETRPTAAFCANDLVALGLLQQCVRAGVRVPEDVAILGYDDIDFAAAAAVPLSSVRQPRQELGLAAADLALDEARNPHHRHQNVVFTPELIARRSTWVDPFPGPERVIGPRPHAPGA